MELDHASGMQVFSRLYDISVFSNLKRTAWWSFQNLHLSLRRASSCGVYVRQILSLGGLLSKRCITQVPPEECDGVKRPALSSATCLCTFLGGMMLISYIVKIGMLLLSVMMLVLSTRALLDSPKESCPSLVAAAFTTPALDFPYTAWPHLCIEEP